MGCLYVDFVGLHVSVIHMTIIRSVRATEIAMQQRFPERIKIIIMLIREIIGIYCEKSYENI